MIVELHMIQNFAPSNLNRDDTGAPKDCEFGGVRRARISSQCFKRAIRTHFETARLLDDTALATRTRLLVDDVARRLAERGRDRDQATTVVEAALAAAGFGVDDDRRTKYLLFLGRREIAQFTDVCNQFWDALHPPASTKSDIARSGRDKAAKAPRRDKPARPEVPRELKSSVVAVLDGGKAADLALFGRMLADMPEKNIDAASQVAHAISTHKAAVEFDYYTAVDDLQGSDESGAGMIGTVEFASACFYRYLNVHLDRLRKNLDGDDELARKTLSSFVRAAVLAIPTGKQNSMAAHSLPSFVMAVARRHGLWSLVNAFATPVRATEHKGLVTASIEALDAYWGRMAAAYGSDAVIDMAAFTVEPDAELVHVKPANIVPTLEALVSRTVAAATAPVPAA